MNNADHSTSISSSSTGESMSRLDAVEQLDPAEPTVS